MSEFDTTISKHKGIYVQIIPTKILFIIYIHIYIRRLCTVIANAGLVTLYYYSITIYRTIF